MKLEKILDNLNSFEKNSFLKIIDGILNNNPKNERVINDILINASSRELKSMDNINISRVFNLASEEFTEIVKDEFLKTSSQLDVLIDILSRDGNTIMKQDWLARLYEKELKKLRIRITDFKKRIDSESIDNELRIRDCKIYRACLNTAYTNDDLNNQERKITSDELSILVTLAQKLGLSQEEIRLINYSIIPLQKQIIDDVINELKNIGVIFYSKKYSTIYVADEMVKILRKIRGKEVADKYFRRVLKLLREPQLNLICKQHDIEWRNPIDVKINDIIKEGLNFSSVLIDDIHRPGTTLTEKKKLLNQICDKGLNISPALKGSVIEEKIENLILYFDEVERDEKVGISIDGYEKLLIDLQESISKLNNIIKQEFELQEEKVLKSSFLLDYNIKPRDILELIPDEAIKSFCENHKITTRGDLTLNILDNYKDADNLFLENFENIGYRNLAALKENGLILKESTLGAKFEELTKTIFEKLGFNVDEETRKSVNTAKDKMDVLINLGNNEFILVECKTIKESGYNKFSAVSRQLKSYSKLAQKNGLKVIKSLLIAPEFSDEFIKDCGLDYELNLSLITARSLQKILEGFKESKLEKFPNNLFMRDVLIQETRVLKAISR